MIQRLSKTHRRRLGGYKSADVPQAQADALLWLYDATAGATWTNNSGWGIDPIVENWHGITVTAGNVSGISLNNNNLQGDITEMPWDQWPGLATISFSGNDDGDKLSGLVTDWVLPSGLGLFNIADCSFSGDPTGWTVKPNCASVYLDRNAQLSGDMSSWAVGSSVNRLYLYQTGLYGAPDLSGATGIQLIRYWTCGLSQAQVDAVFAEVYANRASFAHSTPELLIGGTNAVPSGAYADEDPPTTGLGYVYELCNDPESEGFYTWEITYRANGGDVTKP